MEQENERAGEVQYGETDREPVVLPGGVANVGAVLRDGGEVLRPQRPSTKAAHALFRHVRAQGFLGVPEPRGIEGGVERLSYIPGDVPQLPFPDWWRTDAVLASTARLLRGFHDASEGFASPADAQWNAELADPTGSAEVLCTTTSAQRTSCTTTARP